MFLRSMTDKFRCFGVKLTQIGRRQRTFLFGFLFRFFIKIYKIVFACTVNTKRLVCLFGTVKSNQ